MADDRGHMTNLALAAFAQHHAQPGGGLRTGVVWPRQVRRWAVNHLHFGRRRFALTQLDALAQLAQRAGQGPAFHKNQVFLRVLVARVRELVRQVAIIGQQHQALAVIIQPPHGIEALRHLDQVGEARATVCAFGVRKIASRFIQQDVARRFGASQRTAIEQYHIFVGVHARPQFSNHLAIDFDAAVHDHLFACAPRGNARMRHDFLQTLFHLFLSPCPVADQYAPHINDCVPRS